MKTHPRSILAMACACAVLLTAATVPAAQTNLTAPAGSVLFGNFVQALPNGNIVVTDPNFSGGIGAVYVFTPTGTLLSTLTGSTADDHVGGIGPEGIVVLANSNFLVVTPTWRGGGNGSISNAGAVTWVNGGTGLPVSAAGAINTVSSLNSIVGSRTNDALGLGGVVTLPSGNYVIVAPSCDNGALADAGAVIWGNGSTGAVAGVVSASNALMGSAANDTVGSNGVGVLANGNYVVLSPAWDNGGATNAGAATWGSGATGVRGLVSASNSLVGNKPGDQVGISVTPLTNGNYVVGSPNWDFGASTNIGAATWGKGVGGTVGAVSGGNSLTGSAIDDNVGLNIVALTNGNYVVGSPNWHGGFAAPTGAATWGNGATGITGLVGFSNSLVGSKSGDRVSGAGITPLTNGNYVVASDQWDGNTLSDAGAATWGSGATGIVGIISSTNSFIGTKTDDQVADGGVVPLTNGNYVVVSSFWRNDTITAAGAVTWGNGATGGKGEVSVINSLVGEKAGDRVGSGGVVALTNGNYVVSSELWDDPTPIANVGAVTWGNGATGSIGLVSAANSLLGSTANDRISGNLGFGFGIVPLTNGNYVIVSPLWNNGAAADAGAVTWASGTAVTTGTVTSANSLVGTVNNARVGAAFDSGQSVFPLANGNYVVNSPFGDPSGNPTTGAVTWGSGTVGVSGPITANNSLVGSAFVQYIGEVPTTVLSNGDYIVNSPSFGASGAVTLGIGGTGTVGLITSSNSVLGVPPQPGAQTVFSYNTSWEQLIVGQAAVNLVTLFTYPAPDLTVEQPVATFIPDGGSSDFGSVLTGTNTSLTFTVTNTGASVIDPLTLTLDGPNAADFTITAPPAGTLAANASTTFTIRFAPVVGGTKMAALHLNTGASAQSSFDIVLIGTGVAPTVPVVTTVAVDPATLSITGATLRGTVNAKGSDRTVVFQYGKAGGGINYTNEVAAVPGLVSGNTPTSVSAVIGGLEPHTKYNYRVKASGFTGDAVGANLTFTTLDSQPVAVDDTFTVLPGSKVVLTPLTGDSDPDGDVLSLVSYTALNPTTAGTLAKVGNTVIFTAKPGFNTNPGGIPSATFNYVVKDNFGKNDTGTVTVNAAAATLNPTTANVLSASGAYPIDVIITGGGAGLWSVTESLPWVTVSPASGTGDQTVTVTYLPNAAKAARSGIITIAGQTHTITQAGVVIPSISAPVVPPAVVGNPYSLTIPTVGAPVTYTVTNMPAGLKMNNATGEISGIPTKGIPYLVKVKAANAAGPAPTVVEFTIDVKPLHVGSVGVFHGFVNRDPDINGNLGSRIEVTTTAVGGYTGKIVTGATSQALTGKMTTFPNNVDHPKITLVITRKAPLLSLTLTLNLDGPNNNLSGTLVDTGGHTTDIAAWRNSWTTANKATAFAGLHTFGLELDDPNPALPQGFGYGSFTVKDTTGALTVAGKLSDGSAYTTATFVGKDGQILVYQPLYANRGSFGGTLNLNSATHAVSVLPADGLTWFKPAPVNPATSTDTVYKGGFGPLDVIADGGLYVPPAKGKVVMNMKNNTALNAQLQFTPGGGIDPAFSVNFDMINPSATGLTSKVKPPILNNPNKVNLPTVTAATGLFSGDFTLTAVPAANTRKVTFQGIIVNGSLGTHGYGYFLLPETPNAPGETIAKTPKISGRVQMNTLIAEP